MYFKHVSWQASLVTAGLANQLWPCQVIPKSRIHNQASSYLMNGPNKQIFVSSKQFKPSLIFVIKHLKGASLG
jgi:hypothetical protein